MAATIVNQLIGQYAWSFLLPGDPALAPDYSASAIRLDRKACYSDEASLGERPLTPQEFFYLRRAAPFVDEAARRTPGRPALASLLLLNFALTAFPLFRADLLRFRTNLLASRPTRWTTLLCVRDFCAALAFAAIVPSAAPIDFATWVKSAPSLVVLVRVFICKLPFLSE
jgi:hypothetical protein